MPKTLPTPTEKVSKTAEARGQHLVWALTPAGVQRALELAAALPDTLCLFHDTELLRNHYAGLVKQEQNNPVQWFERLSTAVAKQFAAREAHIFIMSTGIVVRMIAPHILHKTKDPAVVVIDDAGIHCISLLSGHLGGANRLALAAAKILAADPVITTATDVNEVPAIDVLAKDFGMKIINPETIKYVNMALLTRQRVPVCDPDNWLAPKLDNRYFSTVGEMPTGDGQGTVYVSDRILPSFVKALRLCPPALIAGIGCNRNTEMAEIRDLLMEVLTQHNLYSEALGLITSVDIKNDEQGILFLADDLSLPLEFFTREQLRSVEGVQTPSKMVEKHIGVQSVCEAAAILGSEKGQLVVPKQNTKNVTVAIARRHSTF